MLAFDHLEKQKYNAGHIGDFKFLVATFFKVKKIIKIIFYNSFLKI